ncbi:MAG: YgiT-type zinc finger protein [Candidatus Diapherotrites archaeon]|nr:YgiT-type zinc finger protein [Candidatus Diapherotrites archaeon]
MALKTKMKCPLCEGKAKLTKITTKLFNGLIVLNDEPVYECIKCGEKFATGKMVDASVKKAKEAFTFKRQIISTGGSLGITFPSDLSEYYGLNQGTRVSIIPKNKNTIEIITQKN